jgi:preprotein translocase subunit SecB
MPKKLKKHSGDKYREFLKSLHVGSIALSDCTAQIDRTRYFDTEEELMLVAKTKAINIKKDAFDVEATIAVRSHEVGKKDGSLKIDATYLLHFHGKAPVQSTHIKRFVDGDVRLVIWPYFREFVAATTGRMHIPPVTLPITAREEQ